MDGQITIKDIKKNNSYRRDGRLTECPKWANDRRCGTCEFWEIVGRDEQPPDGNGVFGSCSFRGRYGALTNQYSYCQEWKEDSFMA